MFLGGGGLGGGLIGQIISAKINFVSSIVGALENACKPGQGGPGHGSGWAPCPPNDCGGWRPPAPDCHTLPAQDWNQGSGQNWGKGGGMSMTLAIECCPPKPPMDCKPPVDCPPKPPMDCKPPVDCKPSPRPPAECPPKPPVDCLPKPDCKPDPKPPVDCWPKPPIDCKPDPKPHPGECRHSKPHYDQWGGQGQHGCRGDKGHHGGKGGGGKLLDYCGSNKGGGHNAHWNSWAATAAFTLVKNGSNCHV